MNSQNLMLAILFAASLMLMGMAAWPFELFHDDQPSSHLVAGFRLAFVGLLALAVGLVTEFRKPQQRKFTRTDMLDWAIFVAIAVLGVNAALTYALLHLDDRMAMAVMLLAIGVVFIWHYPTNKASWLAVTFALAGTVLLVLIEPENDAAKQNNLVGFVFAAVGGVMQGIMFFRKRLMPQNIDPGIALGTAFFVGGVFMMAVTVVITPAEELTIHMPSFITGTLLSAAMTVVGWLILAYAADKLTGAQKSGAAAFEPVGAATTQFMKDGTPNLIGVIAVIFLVISAVMAGFLNEKPRESVNKKN